MAEIAYYLMHKDDIVTILTLDEDGGITHFSNNYMHEECIPYDHRIDKFTCIKKWWRERAIPNTRDNIKRILESHGVDIPEQYLMRNLGLSLSDCYWIRPIDSDLKWKDVNLFENDFKDNILETNTASLAGKTVQYSPNSSLQGDLEKTWAIVRGKRYIIKGNHGYLSSESINEVIATRIHESLGYENYTKYDLINIKKKPYDYGCRAEIFTSEKKELVSAYAIVTSMKKPNDISWYEHLISVCEAYGMYGEEVRYNLEYQMLTDYIMSGYDRHLNNIAFLRDADNLKFLDVAPIFDSGGSFFAGKEMPKSKKDLENIETNGFTAKEKDKLKYVRDFSIVDLSKLPPVSYIRKMYEKDTKIYPQMIEAICMAYEIKIEMVRKLQLGKSTDI